jgi:hypothetical protein
MVVGGRLSTVYVFDIFDFFCFLLTFFFIYKKKYVMFRSLLLSILIKILFFDGYLCSNLLGIFYLCNWGYFYLYLYYLAKLISKVYNLVIKCYFLIINSLKSFFQRMIRRKIIFTNLVGIVIIGESGVHIFLKFFLKS